MSDRLQIQPDVELYPGCRIVGPSLRSDGRVSVTIVYPHGTRRPKLYCRYIMELHLGRYLSEEEHVHHIDGDYNNNKIENLQVLMTENHSKVHHKKKDWGYEWFVCPECKEDFVLQGHQLRVFLANIKRRKQRGPFCSPTCHGRDARRIQTQKRRGEYVNK